MELTKDEQILILQRRLENEENPDLRCVISSQLQELQSNKESKEYKFTFFSDAGHGWLKVPKKLLAELNIADKISRYSYQRGDNAYLEEDCDAGRLISALKVLGHTVSYKECYSNGQSSIRRYSQYSY